MKAGILKEKIEIWKPIVVTTEFGSSKIEYELSYTTRSSVIHNSGYKNDSNNEIFYSQDKTFIVRTYVPVVENMRIRYDGKFYAINSIIVNKYYNDKTIDATLVNE